MHHQENPTARAEARHSVNTVETAAPESNLARRLNRQDAAKFLTEAGLPIAATTLAKKAVQGNGPPFRIGNGRALYDAADLLTWAESQIGPKLTSTAQRKKVTR